MNAIAVAIAVAVAIAPPLPSPVNVVRQGVPAPPKRLELPCGGESPIVALHAPGSVGSDVAARDVALFFFADARAEEAKIDSDLAVLRQAIGGEIDLLAFVRSGRTSTELARSAEEFARRVFVAGGRFVLVAIGAGAVDAQGFAALRPDLAGKILVFEHIDDAAFGIDVPFRVDLDEKAERESMANAIRECLDRFHAAAARADLDAYIGCLAHDGVFLGTDASERWPTPKFRAYCAPWFAQGKGWTYVAKERNVELAADGRTATFDERLENAKYGEVRGSGAVRQVKDGGWRIVQYNLTFTIPNEKAPAVVELLRGS